MRFILPISPFLADHITINSNTYHGVEIWQAKSSVPLNADQVFERGSWIWLYASSETKRCQLLYNRRYALIKKNAIALNSRWVLWLLYCLFTRKQCSLNSLYVFPCCMIKAFQERTTNEMHKHILIRMVM